MIAFLTVNDIYVHITSELLMLLYYHIVDFFKKKKITFGPESVPM